MNAEYTAINLDFSVRMDPLASSEKKDEIDIAAAVSGSDIML